jgi:predicted permease
MLFARISVDLTRNKASFKFLQSRILPIPQNSVRIIKKMRFLELTPCLSLNKVASATQSLKVSKE